MERCRRIAERPSIGVAVRTAHAMSQHWLLRDKNTREKKRSPGPTSAGLGVRGTGTNLAPNSLRIGRAKKLGTGLRYCWRGCFAGLLLKLVLKVCFGHS